MMRTQPGHDRRNRELNGELSKKHGNTMIMSLRNTYGRDFAKGEAGNSKLRDVLDRLDEPSLTKLLQEFYRGR